MPSSDQNSVSISIIIVTHNSSDEIIACLESVISQSENPNAEIIVVVNASSDATVDIICSYSAKHPKLFLHQNDFLYQSISTFHWSNGWKNVYGVRLCFRNRGRSRYYEVIFANSSFNNFTQTIAVISLISRSGLYSTMSAPTIS